MVLIVKIYIFVNFEWDTPLGEFQKTKILDLK